MALSRPFKKYRLALPVSTPGDQRCDVLGFVPAGSISSCSTLHIFREASRLWGLLCPPVCLLGHFPALRHVQGSTPTGVFEGDVTNDTFQSGLPSPLFAASPLNLWGGRHVWSHCRLLGQSSMGGCFHLHCQAGGWDPIGCTVFMDGGRTLLDSEAPPWLAFGDWAISEVLWFTVFLNKMLDLRLCFACWPFLSMLSQVFWQEHLKEMPESVWVFFSLLGLLELCQLAYLQYWVLCLTHARVGPSQPQSASLCVFHSFMGWVVGIFNSNEVCFDLFHFLSGLHGWEVEQEIWSLLLFNFSAAFDTIDKELLLSVWHSFWHWQYSIKLALLISFRNKTVGSVNSHQLAESALVCSLRVSAGSSFAHESYCTVPLKLISHRVCHEIFADDI